MRLRGDRGAEAGANDGSNIRDDDRRHRQQRSLMGAGQRPLRYGRRRTKTTLQAAPAKWKKPPAPIDSAAVLSTVILLKLRGARDLQQRGRWLLTNRPFARQAAISSHPAPEKQCSRHVTWIPLCLFGCTNLGNDFNWGAGQQKGREGLG
ncbi:unnamed protein product [Heligmosomoides polygyrus]|uniref:Uncharacterized protein n=1 Tax=Heligmosomoides polygyrus TaxID=6339 RepID=A0A183GFR0_HELPZ|nr:unnamed protein product [Heligmosomoides polygyrus]